MENDDDARTSSSDLWEQALGGLIPKSLEEDIRGFESQMHLRRLGKLDEKIFAESRLRRGIYGQRYDNGVRRNSRGAQNLDFPSGELTKGPSTLWDAPGMVRIKIPFGELAADQLETIADLAEETSDSICHVTTRQDIQLHYVHIDDTPEMMRRLAAVGVTTKEACGNSIRNVTACPMSGVCTDESFDVTPYAKALASFLLGHPDAQDFGRKFKISFSGCGGHACALGRIHDLGFVAVSRSVDGGAPQRGFRVLVGGGLGAVPHQAKAFDEFLPVEELLPTVQAMCRLFASHGERRNRSKARMKFLIAKLGIDRFKELVELERQELRTDPRWWKWLPRTEAQGEEASIEPPRLAAGPAPETATRWIASDDRPSRPSAALETRDFDSSRFREWLSTNVRAQAQRGYYAVTIVLPLGDLTADQSRHLAQLSRQFNGGTLRATIEQNLLLRWVSGADLEALYEALDNHGLARSGAGTIKDVTSCPGTDTCKLGISSSRGLAAELERRMDGLLARIGNDPEAAVANLRIKISGCFNSCGQHHVADLGFYGVRRKIRGHDVPHFQVIVGGRWTENGGSFGLPLGAVPSKRVPDVIESIVDTYRRDRQAGESFQAFVSRVGRSEIKRLVSAWTTVPSPAEDSSFYSDWGDPRQFSVADMGIGECAGEVVSMVDFGLAESEQAVFDAQLELERGSADRAAEQAYRSMIRAARALVRTEYLDVGEEPEAVIEEFRNRFHRTERFHDPFAGAKFANYLFAAHDSGRTEHSFEQARRRIEEAGLFIEAAHACNARRLAAGASR